MPCSVIVIASITNETDWNHNEKAKADDKNFHERNPNPQNKKISLRFFCQKSVNQRVALLVLCSIAKFAIGNAR